MPRNDDILRLPSDLPVPVDDGMASHLPGLPVAKVSLPSTWGKWIDLSALAGRTVVYCYPRTGRPDEEPPDGWNLIPGARGCTPQSCAFRDHHRELEALGARVFGLSSQDTEYQREAAERLHLPFALLSDEQLAFASAMRLPQFDAGSMRLLKRLTSSSVMEPSSTCSIRCFRLTATRNRCLIGSGSTASLATRQSDGAGLGAGREHTWANDASSDRAAIGFTVKSGWACAVLVAGSATSPRVVDSRRVDLSDPAIPESRQPYHAGVRNRTKHRLRTVNVDCCRQAFRTASGHRGDSALSDGWTRSAGRRHRRRQLDRAGAHCQRSHPDPCARGPVVSSCRAGCGGPKQAVVLDLARTGPSRTGGRSPEAAGTDAP